MKGPERSVVAGVGPGSNHTWCMGTFWGVHPLGCEMVPRLYTKKFGKLNDSLKTRAFYDMEVTPP